ncbi:hypothetical protein K5X82_18020 [Halosquirtibacter xylanolyticus]|uniref:hypothetical protein n=1 Tax=Halosquirtibacter xylanolyticus TaxID=3374599 RepID=UPI003747CBAE|nr:hypothetical protein K5X82_18020 [Prolixibacteraceae bacterium]
MKPYILKFKEAVIPTHQMKDVDNNSSTSKMMGLGVLTEVYNENDDMALFGSETKVYNENDICLNGTETKTYNENDYLPY